MIPVVDALYYKDDILKYEKQNASQMSYFIRTGLGFSYGISLSVALWIAIIHNLALPISAGSLYYAINIDSLIQILLWLTAIPSIVFVFRRLVQDLAGMLGIEGARKGEARVELREAFNDDNSFLEYRNRLANVFFRRNRYDVIGVIIGIGSIIAFHVSDALYYLSIGNPSGYFVGGYLWRTGIMLPPHLIIFSWIADLGYGVAVYFVVNAIFRLLHVMVIFSQIGKYGNSLDVNDVVLITSGKEIDEFPETYGIIGFWRLGNEVFRMFSKIAIIAIFFGFVLTLYSFVASVITPMEYTDFAISFRIVGLVVIGAAFLILLLPLIGFRSILVEVKSHLIRRIKTIYEKTMIIYLSLDTIVERKEEMNEEIETLNNVVEYCEELSVWPVSAPVLIRLAVVGIASLAIAVLAEIWPILWS